MCHIVLFGTGRVFTAQSVTNSAFGSYAVTGGGVWTYTLDNSSATVEALNAGGTLVDTFSVFTADGTPQTITISINGRNDSAVISGTISGTIIEAGGVDNSLVNNPSAVGTLTDTDVDNPLNTFTAQGTIATTYGTYTMTAGGVWTYTVDNTNAAVEALNVGDALTDTFTVTAQDGTAQAISIAINGRNDNAVITNSVSGMVKEAGAPGSGQAGLAVIEGVLAAADKDNPSNVFVPVQNGIANYGAFKITANGVWTYVLDNSNSVVEALGNQSTLVDSFTIRSIDGTPQVISITIQGTSNINPGGAGVQLTLGSALVDTPVPNVQTFESARPATQTTTETGADRGRVRINPIASLSDAFGNVDFDDSADRRSFAAASRTAFLRGGEGFFSRGGFVGRQGDLVSDIAGYDFGDYRFQLGRFTLVQQLSGRAANATGLDSSATDGAGKGGAGQEFTATTAAHAAGLSVALGIAAWALRSGGLVAAMLSSLPAWRQMDLLPVLGNSDDKRVATELADGAGSEVEREEQAVSRILGNGQSGGHSREQGE